MKTPKLISLKYATLALGLLTGSQFLHASLDVSYQFNGKGNWSLDAVGGNNTPTGNVQAFVPVGSLIQKAFLYTSFTPGGQSGFTGLTFDGTLLGSIAFTNLGLNPSASLVAYRADVTALVQAKVGGGSASIFDFLIDEGSKTGSTDGEVLAIVYSNPFESERTIAFLDGFSNSTPGDTFTVNLGAPMIDPTTPGFEALFSLGIGYSYQEGVPQFSQVDVNGRRLTTSAGGNDDGTPANGGLITVGGLGDSSLNPLDPFAQGQITARQDDELYNLALGNPVNSNPFLTTGSTSFTVNTINPSNNDNIFFAGLNITARAGVNAPPPPPPNPGPGPDLGAVPEPSTYGLIGAVALLGLAMRRRFKK